MKDLVRHLKHVQRKVIQSVRRAENNQTYENLFETKGSKKAKQKEFRFS